MVIDQVSDTRLPDNGRPVSMILAHAENPKSRAFRPGGSVGLAAVRPLRPHLCTDVAHEAQASEPDDDRV